LNMTRALLLYQMFFYYSLTHPLFTVQTDDYKGYQITSDIQWSCDYVVHS
jgi:hypothetical protein